MGQELVHAAPQALAQVEKGGDAIMRIIEKAMASPDFDVAKLTALLSIKEQWDKNEAKKAYNESFTAFKAEALQIVKRTDVKAGPLAGKKYADLPSVVNIVTPALSRHGLSAAWAITKDEKDWIEVTCTIKHVLGHSESVSIGGPPDTGGAKSPLQARGSTLSYLERYTLKAITGLSEQDDDTDGRPEKRMADSAVADWQAAIEGCADEAAAKAMWQQVATATKAAGDVEAHEQLRAALTARLKAIKSSKGAI